MPKDDRVLVSFESADDAAVVRLDGNRFIVQSVDFFTPIVDDPYQFGQIAAANSLSDIYAMGGTPLFALNIVAFPIQDLPKTILSKILQGGADKASEAGITIAGGHSIDDKEPKYGMVVTGEVEKDKLIKNSGAQIEDALILTKPLGTGIISTAIKQGYADQNQIDIAVKSMSTLNKTAAEIMNDLDVHAATDVTGFGLLGRLLEMCKASNVSAEINFKNLDFLPGVRELAEKGIIPGGSKRNLDFVNEYVHFQNSLSEIDQLLAADAQTSGGLLISLSNENADKFLDIFNSTAPFPAYKIGLITKKTDYIISI